MATCVAFLTALLSLSLTPHYSSGYAKCHRQSRSSGFSALRQLSELTIYPSTASTSLASTSTTLASR